MITFFILDAFWSTDIYIELSDKSKNVQFFIANSSMQDVKIAKDGISVRYTIFTKHRSRDVRSKQ